MTLATTARGTTITTTIFNYNTNFNYNYNDNGPPPRQSYFRLTPSNQVVNLSPLDTQFITIDIRADTPAPTLNLRGVATITGDTFRAVLPGPITIWPFLGGAPGNTYVIVTLPAGTVITGPARCVDLRLPTLVDPALFTAGFNGQSPLLAFTFGCPPPVQPDEQIALSRPFQITMAGRRSQTPFVQNGDTALDGTPELITTPCPPNINQLPANAVCVRRTSTSLIVGTKHLSYFGAVAAGVVVGEPESGKYAA